MSVALLALAVAAALQPISFVITRKMLVDVKLRAERAAPEALENPAPRRR